MGLEAIADELAESELLGVDREGVSKLAALYTNDFVCIALFGFLLVFVRLFKYM